MKIDPNDSYVYLAADGASKVIPGGNSFWSQPEAEIDKFGRGWLISEFVCSEDWPSWEMHPNADEFIYLLEGDIEFVMERPSGIESTRLSGRGAVVVPKGTWHTARVRAPSRMLFATMGAGTRHRPNRLDA